jgi:heat-inducible transcriptional repressor
MDYMTVYNLTDREQEILESVVQYFVLTGNPVGSRTLSKGRKWTLSPASIRNVMADLEDKGFLDHPHPSAGRIPTTRGYRHYVDNLVEMIQLSEEEKDLIKENIGQFSGDIDLILEKTLQVLAKVSNLLGVILTPKFDEGILEKIDIIRSSSEKLLMILSIRDGIAKTILLEVHHELADDLLAKITQLLNERLAGLKISKIKSTFRDRLSDLVNEESGLIRLFIDSADKFFDFTRYSNVIYSGTTNILNYPEFSDINKFSTLIELFEEKNIIVHMMEKRNLSPELKVTIGDENEEALVQNCSIITAPYTVGDIDGILGVIGPTRIVYSRVIPIVDFTAKFITNILQSK